VIGSCDVTSRIVDAFAVLKFHCLFEETKLYANCMRREMNARFVQMMAVGVFELEVGTYSHNHVYDT
jgi:hypothetical protein